MRFKKFACCFLVCLLLLSGCSAQSEGDNTKLEEYQGQEEGTVQQAEQTVPMYSLPSLTHLYSTGLPYRTESRPEKQVKIWKFDAETETETLILETEYDTMPDKYTISGVYNVWYTGEAFVVNRTTRRYVDQQAADRFLEIYAEDPFSPDLPPSPQKENTTTLTVYDENFRNPKVIYSKSRISSTFEEFTLNGAFFDGVNLYLDQIECCVMREEGFGYNDEVRRSLLKLRLDGTQETEWEYYSGQNSYLFSMIGLTTSGDIVYAKIEKDPQTNYADGESSFFSISPNTGQVTEYSEMPVALNDLSTQSYLCDMDSRTIYAIDVPSGERNAYAAMPEEWEYCSGYELCGRLVVEAHLSGEDGSRRYVYENGEFNELTLSYMVADKLEMRQLYLCDIGGGNLLTIVSESLGSFPYHVGSTPFVAEQPIQQWGIISAEDYFANQPNFRSIAVREGQ